MNETLVVLIGNRLILCPPREPGYFPSQCQATKAMNAPNAQERARPNRDKPRRPPHDGGGLHPLNERKRAHSIGPRQVVFTMMVAESKARPWKLPLP
jgi:hypothetical protein